MPWCLSQTKEVASWIKVQMLAGIDLLGQKMESASDGSLRPEALVEVWVAGDRRLSLRG